MACDALQQQLVDYLENRLTPANRSVIEAHLAGCEVCAVTVQQLAWIDEALTRAISAPPLPTDFGARLQQQVQRQSAVSLPEAQRAERRRQLHADFEMRLVELRRNSLSLMSLIERLGSAALVGLAGWLLLNVVLAHPDLMGQEGMSGLTSTLLVSLIASGVFVLVGLSAAFRPQFNRLCAAILGSSRTP